MIQALYGSARRRLDGAARGRGSACSVLQFLCPGRRSADSACARGAGIRRREDHRQAVRPPRRRAGRDHARVLDEQPAAERAGRRGQSDAAGQDDGRRQRLLHDADQRRRVGGLLLQLRRRDLDEQPLARVSARHDRRGSGVAAARARRSAGDPVQAWDRFGNVYYGGIAFNRASRRTARSGSPATAGSGAGCPTTRAAIVARGTPSPIFLGLFNDKVMIEVDRSENAATTGNVYVCWALFTASGANTTASSSPVPPTAGAPSRTG